MKIDVTYIWLVFRFLTLKFTQPLDISWGYANPLVFGVFFESQLFF